MITLRVRQKVVLSGSAARTTKGRQQCSAAAPHCGREEEDKEGGKEKKLRSRDETFRNKKEGEKNMKGIHQLVFTAEFLRVDGVKLTHLQLVVLGFADERTIRILFKRKRGVVSMSRCKN